MHTYMRNAVIPMSTQFRCAASRRSHVPSVHVPQEKLIELEHAMQGALLTVGNCVCDSLCIAFGGQT